MQNNVSVVANPAIIKILLVTIGDESSQSQSRLFLISNIANLSDHYLNANRAAYFGKTTKQTTKKKTLAEKGAEEINGWSESVS